MKEKTIGEISKFTGVSPHTIKYYEKIGLISSNRRESSNYRSYQVNACTDIYECMKCRNMDFSLKDTKILLQEADSSLLSEMLSTRSQELDEQIAELQRQKEIVDSYRKEIRQMDERLGKWYVAEVPDLYMKKQTQNLEYLENSTPIVGEWNLTNAGPACKSVVCLDRSFVNGGEPSYSWGLGGCIKKEELPPSKQDDVNDIIHVPACRAFIAYAKFSGHYVSNGEMIKSIHKIFSAYATEVPSDVYAIRIKITHDENGNDWHFFRILIPLD